MSVENMVATQQFSEPDIRDVERTLYREASLLDKADIEGWLEMYTEDGTYWMPVTGPYYFISRYYGPNSKMNGKTVHDIIFKGTELATKFTATKF